MPSVSDLDCVRVRVCAIMNNSTPNPPIQHQTPSTKQVPISWVGDALCNFGVPPPIQWTARIGDLIDGEQAFEILEVGTL